MVLSALLFTASAFAQEQSVDYNQVIKVRTRVIIDNDFGGDPDGLFQLAHHLLSPTVDVKAIIGSKHYDGGFYGYPGDATYSAKMASELLAVMHLSEKYSVYEGSSSELKDTLTPMESEGAKAIVREAMRDDVKEPLYVVCGAGLTNIASAWLMEPQIAERIILIWIGGTEYDGLATPPPGATKNWEYNTGIDAKACQVIFNQSNIPIWQVPRDAYRQALTSYAELTYKVKGMGDTGRFLVSRLDDLMKRADKGLGEAYALGDSPLVLLTALQSAWEVDPSSSKYAVKKAPRVNGKGYFEENRNGRGIRVYYDLDVRLMFEDFFAKLALFSGSPG
ncbi:inosine-uridine nucleoside N-ribohydrolase [Mangrovibacterium diazotrophicum]|uniref:Inosine-uridine nucleoside N-ribohydrolase n=1 Tax=Mangrovibacterium diazotrophicum TaxID=1261403 RepID=A0A419W643_9BACT|nr:inosine-uridine nucleoside N-ribohydrolase [Mangrovibacterium diazotrophicum]